MSRVPVILLKTPYGSFVSMAEHVAAIDDLLQQDETAAEVTFNIDPAVGIRPQAISDPRLLEVSTPLGPAYLKTTATLHLTSIDAEAFYHLPWLLRRGVCQPWVRGAVLPSAASAANINSGPLVWIDLLQLAESLLRGRKQW